MKLSEEVLKFLNLGIESEIAAYVFYKRAARLIEDPALRAILERLAGDEKGHFLSLEDLYDRNVRSEMWAPYKDILNTKGLPDIDELVQETHKELLGRIQALKARKEVLKMALSLEREAYDLFHTASAKTKDPEAKKLFDYLSAFEMGHVQTIEKELSAA
jgi:rubrerythrin